MSPTRRDFVRLCASAAVGFGLSPLLYPAIRVALGKAVSQETPPVFWIQGQSCGGCTLSFLNCLQPESAQLLSSIIGMRYHRLLMQDKGKTPLEHLLRLSETLRGRFILVVEGAVPVAAEGRYCRCGLFPGGTVSDVVRTLGAHAAVVMAAGTCAAFGGIPAAAGQVTGASGAGEVLKKAEIATPVVNVPGCPAHPDWIAGTLTLLLDLLDKQSFENEDPLINLLDGHRRPLLFYGRNLHEHCPRLSDNTAGKLSAAFPAAEGCLRRLGCKGPRVACDAFERLWNGRVNWCVNAALCTGCTEPSFPDGSSPFYTATPD